ncbi:MAG TPA: hypothetical protein VFQ35_01825 [Polyangiaceae bacterium]|nr:hypothetical protein [Polyangiaceae bacterium]
MAILALHALIAVAMFELLPRGFPISHPRFYANEAAPTLLLAISATIGAGLARGHPAAIALLAVFPGAWLGVAVAASVSFPITGGRVVVAAAVVAFILGALWLNLARRVRRQWALTAIALSLGFGGGAALVRSQRAPAPSTRPHALTSPLPPELPSIDPKLPAGVSVDAANGTIQLRSGAVELALLPLLEFESRSPDRFWTLFSPLLSERLAPPPSSERRIRVESPDGSRLQVHASRALRGEVFSHLASFTRFSLRGHARLGISFSPCPAAVIDFVHADYPSGAPARFAYLDEASTFHVVEASSAEKGPFSPLATGPLRRGEPLSIRLLELSNASRRTLFELTFEDWSAELSTALSPTAGFGVAENAIEFGLASPAANSDAYVILNLAATSVGRGWDSVGHAAGLYENRISVQSFETELHRE